MSKCQPIQQTSYKSDHVILEFYQNYVISGYRLLPWSILKVM